jgi:hypothetical protein
MWQVQRAVEPLVRGFWNYLHLDKVLKLEVKILQRGIHTYQSEQDFWRDLNGRDSRNNLATEQLELGDVVELKGFQLTEWFPRLPGTYWTPEAATRRQWATRHREHWDQETEVLTPEGKTPASDERSRHKSNTPP